ncbi:hypothetical protein, partial [Solibacillus cecembensis]|uniref:hypothetical protein n=1 Tax=Solibacillus cecembensis TaxID=459347 RepID=UPI003CFC4C49
KIKRLEPLRIQGSSRIKNFYYSRCLLDREQFNQVEGYFILMGIINNIKMRNIVMTPNLTPIVNTK